jgi:hypothetical protein
MRTEIKAVFTGLVALACVALLAGCPGKLRDPARFGDAGVDGGGGSACPDVPTEIFAARCAGSSCHSGTTPAQKLDLVLPDVAARVVGVQAIECQGVLADPKDPAGSVLYTKVAPGPTCGSRMPLGASLSDAEVACVKAWIAEQTPSAATSTGTGAGGAGGGGTSSTSTGP